MSKYICSFPNVTNFKSSSVHNLKVDNIVNVSKTKWLLHWASLDNKKQYLYFIELDYWVSLRVSNKKQKLLTLREHLGSCPFSGGVLLLLVLVFWVVFLFVYLFIFILIVFDLCLVTCVPNVPVSRLSILVFSDVYFLKNPTRCCFTLPEYCTSNY